MGPLLVVVVVGTGTSAQAKSRGRTAREVFGRGEGVRVGGVPAPGHDGDAGGLCEDGGADFVAEVAHGGGRGSEEGDADGGEGGGEAGVLGGMAPAGPDGVCARAEGEVDDKGHVGVVVGIGSAGHLLEGVGEADVLGAGLEVVGGGHGHKLHHPFIPKDLEGPFANRTDGLDSGDSVVGHQHPLDHAVASAPLDEFAHTRKLRSRQVLLLLLLLDLHLGLLYGGCGGDGVIFARGKVGAGALHLFCCCCCCGWRRPRKQQQQHPRAQGAHSGELVRRSRFRRGPAKWLGEETFRG